MANCKYLNFLDLSAQERVDIDYQDRKLWAKKSILATAGAGKFSSDRTIKDYAENIWNIKPYEIPPSGGDAE